MVEFYDEKTRELKDVAIKNMLITAREMYKNGEIVEVRDLLLDMVTDMNKFIGEHDGNI